VLLCYQVQTIKELAVRRRNDESNVTVEAFINLFSILYNMRLRKVFFCSRYIIVYMKIYY